MVLTLRLFRLYQASPVCSWLLASLLVIYSCSGNDSYGKDQLILETEGRFHGQLKLMVIAKIRSHLTPWPFSAEAIQQQWSSLSLHCGRIYRSLVTTGRFMALAVSSCRISPAAWNLDR